MPGYEPVIHRSAERELDALDDRDRDRLTRVLGEVAQERQPSSHEKVKPLEGQDGLLRVRAGDARAIVELSKPELQIIRIGYRDGVYDMVDDLDERRATA